MDGKPARGMRPVKDEKFTYRLDKRGAMKVPATLFLSEKLLAHVEEEALRQMADAASLDEASYVYATPDIHTGYGVPIGSVVATPHIVSPSAVGYDINCGMRLLSTPLKAREVDPSLLAGKIAQLVPLGEGKRNLSLTKKELEQVVTRGLEGLESILPRLGLLESVLYDLFLQDRERTEDYGSLDGSIDGIPERGIEKGLEQLGTLGGGNHFIEIQEVVSVDDRTRAEALGLFQGQLTCMIHSGSRGLGYQVAGHYMQQAKAYLKSRGIVPPNGQLQFFRAESAEARRYLQAMNGAANFAFANRSVMAILVRQAFEKVFGSQGIGEIRSVYDVTHNIAKEEAWEGRTYTVHRKGATRAFDGEHMRGTAFETLGQPVLIPGSMGTASYVLMGHAGSRRSFYSVNHGAGRVMSRTQAAGRKGKRGRTGVKAAISDQEFKRSMEGVVLICEDPRRIKEEAPAAYKDIDEVIRVVLGAGLALPVARLAPLAVLKG